MMKLIAFLSLIFYPILLASQEPQLDTIDGKFAFRKIVAVDSTSADVLFDRSLQWVASAYVSTNDAVKYQDKVKGKIVVKGSWLHAQGDFYEHSLVIECKDGRVRYTFSDFEIYHTMGAFAGSREPLDKPSLYKKLNKKIFASDSNENGKRLETALKSDGW